MLVNYTITQSQNMVLLSGNIEDFCVLFLRIFIMYSFCDNTVL